MMPQVDMQDWVQDRQESIMDNYRYEMRVVDTETDEVIASVDGITVDDVIGQSQHLEDNAANVAAQQAQEDYYDVEPAEY